ncbi:unnamed protein product [Adineta steineri]|uniref:NAD(+)--protein-arginine ADP-ribosyltransferase n=1 Tax=Adineta steineri TaxID=433720 RepID=A0A814VY12_9BILA|nr:unnamed protein product [Adineta steineri]CAF3835361.1 unnamed protein product [Adineta steineri]
MNRFSDIDCSFEKLTPVYGYRSEKLVSIEKALEPIQRQIGELSYYIKIAKKHCHYPSEHDLTRDESASIYIYTMEWGEQSLYCVLNKTLRNENRHLLKVWFPYLKLFDTALNKLPTVKEVVWRGITADIGKVFTKDQIITWWSINSCSSSVNVIKGFLGNEESSTTFLIEALNGKKVSGHTEHKSEDEIILTWGTEFRVKSNALDHPNGSYLVHLIEIDEENNDNNHTSSQGLLECKSLAELKVTNELKLKANEIIQEKSKLLFKEGTKLLNRLLIEQKQTTEQLNSNNTNSIQVSSDIYLKNFIKNGVEQLHSLTCKLIKDAIDEYEQSTPDDHPDIKSNIQKNIEPRILCTEQLLKQRFEQDIYTISKENAALQIQKQLLNTAKIFFNKQAQTITDLDGLNAVLDERYNELYKKFEDNLNLLRKSESDITETIINIYNGIIKTRGTTADKLNIYNLCPILVPDTYRSEFQELESIYQSIQSYIMHRQTSNNVYKALTSLKDTFSNNSWKTLFQKLGWFNHHTRDDEHKKEIFLSIVEGVIPQFNNNINTMLSTINLSYNDPQLITNLIQYVDGSIKMQTSPIQHYWKYLNVPQIIADLIRLALRFLIDQAKQIADRKHEELKQELNQLKQWKINIQEQFLSSKDSFEQGQRFKTDLQKQIIEEIKRIYTRLIINDVHVEITNNSEIDPDKIATNAYNDSIGSNPPDANNIMKYIIDINRYYLELALNKIKISKETIITNQIHRLQKIIYNCVDKAIETVERHDCHNVQQVYQNIVENLRQILPDFRLSSMIGTRSKIRDPDRFKESFKQLLLDRTNMYEEIVKCKNIFDTAAKESCINLIKTRLGCQARCPGCGTKCDNTEINHTKHYNTRHLASAFYGWTIRGTNKPCLNLCYQFWLKSSLSWGETKFDWTQKYFSEHAPEWLDDLEQKSKTGDLYNDSKPPAEQRRAWMAVRLALIKRYSTDGMVDYEKYDENFYPAIKSVSADFKPEWDYIQS